MNRFYIYLAVIVAMAVYLGIYLDTHRFHNMEKTIYRMGNPVELCDFEKISQTVSPDNMLNSSLVVVDEEPYLKLDGFKDEWLDEQNPRIRKRNALHPTLNLAVFSMGYASDYILHHYRNGTLGQQELDLLERVYLSIYKETIKPYSVNSISVNDHAISERVQFIVLFSGYLQSHHPEKEHLLSCLSRDLRICLGFLTRERHFTWQTNHGIMQLRSLAQIACIIDQEEKKRSILQLVDHRLKEILPFHVGQDGAVYEAAPGYWLYIYEQLEKITGIECLKGTESYALIAKALPDISKFIQVVSSNDGFLQGMGDSYSLFLPHPFRKDSVSVNRFFCYSNQLSGASWTTGNHQFNLLFASLHTPPNVHKLPEDLAVYVYLNRPLFANTGIYSYMISPERLFFETEESQSTVMMADNPFTHPDSSQVAIEDYSPQTGTLRFTGSKTYPGQLRIHREVILDKENRITIRDHSDGDHSLVSHLNLHPGMGIRRVNEREVQLFAGDSVLVGLKSIVPIEITESLISEKKEQLTTTRRIKMSGNPLEVSITIPVPDPIPTLIPITSDSVSYRRLSVSERLEESYGNKDKVIYIKRDFTRKALVLMIVLIAFVIASELYMRRTNHDSRSKA